MLTSTFRTTAFTACLLSAALAHASLLDDPGFALATGGGQTSNSAWTLTVNFPDGAEDAAQFQTAPWASDAADPNDGVGTGVWFKSFEGALGGNLADATLEQVLGNSTGGTYELTFSAKREANFSAGAWYAELSSSGTGGTDSVDLLAVTPNDGTWNSYSLTLIGVTPGDDITVRVVMDGGYSPGVNPQSAFVDNFILTPEPASLALLGMGVVCAGACRRRA